MDVRWIGPSGYIPGLGFHSTGELFQIADAQWAEALEKEGKIKIVDAPRKPKPAAKSEVEE